MTLPVVFTANGPTGYNLTNSLRFRSSASAYLNRTPASAGNRKTWTWSGWVKRGTLGVSQYFFSGGTGGSDTTQTGINFLADNKLNWLGGSGTQYRTTTQVFRDPSAWYHIVLAFDTTLATANDRIKIYVNGTQITAFDNLTNPTQNVDYGVNQTEAHNIGRWTGASGYFDGYLAEVNFIDGQALTPTSFGSFNALTGVWQPARYTGTYGTNGFYLPFTNTTSTSTLGNDFSGNSNTWTVNNISLTAGTTYDSMTDVPTVSTLASNYCVWNPLVTAGGNITCVNANLQTQIGSFGNNSIATIGVTSGKWYWEVTPTFTNNGAYWYIGVSAQGYALATQPDSDSKQWAYYAFNGNKMNGNNTAYGSSYTTNDIIGVALDMDAGTLTFYKNGTSQGQAFSNLAGNTIFPSCSFGNTGSVYFVGNFGQRPFSYTPPTGFVALNTFNLPNSTIVAGNKQMDATTYTGNGTAGRVITVSNITNVGFAWVKLRSGADDHRLANTVTGGNKHLQSNTTAAESTGTNVIQAFSGNTFTIGSDNSVNVNGSTYVGWTWADGGAAVTNTAGTISAQVSANTTSGFSVVTYTGTGASATVGHGLGVAPSMIIAKSRSTVANWQVYHSSISNMATGFIMLNSTAAFSTATSQIWNSTAPTSTVFSLGTDTDINGSANTIVAYCFAQVAGYSAFGSYTGNGSADGTFVYTGFRPKFVLLKSSTQSTDWYIYDTSRDTYNLATLELNPNLAAAEQNGTYGSMDINSNGFKLRFAGGEVNVSSQTYIYMAFAESPFKVSLAR